MNRSTRISFVVFALLASAVTAFPQDVSLEDFDLTLMRAQPEKLTLVVPIDEDGYGSVTIDEPGEYQVQLQSEAKLTPRYFVEAEVAVDYAVATDESARQIVGAIQFTTAPKLHTVEFAGPDSVVIDTLMVGTPGTLVRVRLVVQGPKVETAETESDAR